MKKLIRILLAILILFAFSATSYAEDDSQEALADGVYSIEMVYISSVYCNLSISANGLATVSAHMYAFPGTDSVKISMYLQQYDGGWSSLSHWTAEADGTYVSLSRNQNVTSGYNYRVLAYFYAYEGSQSESTSATDSEYY